MGNKIYIKLKKLFPNLPILAALIFVLLVLDSNPGSAKNKTSVLVGNFGLPGIIDLPTGYRLPDGEIIVSQQVHKSLARSGISFQALPRLGFAFRYSGHGTGGKEAYGRINHDRSFDVHLSVLDEGRYWPSISLGLRDFYWNWLVLLEYIVGTKNFGALEASIGVGFGRLAGRGSFSNPLGIAFSTLDEREEEKVWGTLGSINWFNGKAAAFIGFNYKISENIVLSSEYTPDLMLREREYGYIDIDSPWNHGVKYKLNDYVTLSLDYLHGSEVSFAANVSVNPDYPPIKEARSLPLYQ